MTSYDYSPKFETQPELPDMPPSDPATFPSLALLALEATGSRGFKS